MSRKTTLTCTLPFKFLHRKTTYKVKNDSFNTDECNALLKKQLVKRCFLQ